MRSLQKPPAVIVITAASDSALPREAIVQRYPQAIRAILRKPFDFARLGSCVEKELR